MCAGSAISLADVRVVRRPSCASCGPRASEPEVTQGSRQPQPEELREPRSIPDVSRRERSVEARSMLATSPVLLGAAVSRAGSSKARQGRPAPAHAARALASRQYFGQTRALLSQGKTERP